MFGYKKYLLLLFLFLLIGHGNAQLKVDTSASINALINALVGPGAAISNPILKCPKGGFGTFSGGASTNLGLSNGIVLTSGSAIGIPGAGSSFVSGILGTANDPDLDPLTTAATYDVCRIEFDITPFCNSLQLQFVFGSEEYPEYVGSNFNDVFGFFLSGPNPSGGNYTNANLGVVPGTSTPLTINNVSPVTNSNWYVDNTSGTTIVYDGFTKPIINKINVTPCSVYHMVFAIADAGDAGFDSGIFLAYDGLTCPAQALNLSKDTTICNGGSATLTASGATTYSWAPATGLSTTTGPVVIANPTTNTTYTVTFEGGPCAQPIQKTVTVNMGAANATAGSDLSICGGGSVQLNGSSSGNATYSWSPATGLSDATISNPTANPASTTSYILTVTSGSCIATDTAIVFVSNIPVADFTIQNICLNQAASFQNTSSIVGGTIALHEWDFGDTFGQTTILETAEHPTHLYLSAGTFSVTLIVTTNGGCKDTIIKPVTVNENPLADFNIAAVCAGNSSLYYDGSTITIGAITGWSWDLGDGTTSSLQNPSHNYTVPGSYNATLIATSNNGCKDTINKEAVVMPKPIADFAISPVCVGTSSIFIDHSNTNGGGMITNWNWNFGDNTSSTLQNPQHTYAAAGDYIILLTIASNSGCMDTITKTAIVNTQPVANFSVAPVCENSVSQFNDLSNNGGGSIASWEWKFGDPVPPSSADVTNGPNGSHQYAAAGSYTVTLIIQSPEGCADSIKKTAVVDPLPKPGFSFTNVCLNNSNSFTDQSFISTGNVTSWNWSFGGNNTSSLQNPSFSFSSSGTYPVSLTITSDKGCVQSLTQNVTVYALPQASFTTKNVCGTAAVNYNNTTPSYYSSNLACDWTFGDAYGVIDHNQNPSHSYSNPGTYTVTLIVSSPDQCKDTAISTVTVYPQPKAEYLATNVCQQNTTTFTDQSQANGSTIVFWGWGFGDGTFGVGKNQTHNYGADGIYNSHLKVISLDGCSDSIMKPVEVFSKPNANFNNNSVCLNSNTFFTDKSELNSGTIASWNWNFGDAATGTAASPSHVYSSYGTYTVSVIVTSDKGCKDTLEKQVIVYDNPKIDFTSDKKEGCSPLCVNFKDASTVNDGTITGWKWDFGGAGSGTVQYPENCFDQPGKYTITLTTTSDRGCISTASIKDMIEVYPDPIADFTFDPNPASVVEPTVFFADQSIDAVQWHWNFGDGDSVDAQNPSHVYPANVHGTYSATLTVHSSHGCINSVTKEITIAPDFTLYIPNAFTPNADGKNDFFISFGVGFVEKETYIYDRWGNLIFESNDMNAQWDGKVQNGGSDELAQQDAYVYIIIIKDTLGKQYRYNGHVSLLR